MFCHQKRSPGHIHAHSILPFLVVCMYVCTCVCLRVLGVSVTHNMLQRFSAFRTSPAVSDTWGLLNGCWFSKRIRLFSNSPSAGFCCCLCLFLFLSLHPDCDSPPPPRPSHASLCFNHKVTAIHLTFPLSRQSQA